MWCNLKRQLSKHWSPLVYDVYCGFISSTILLCAANKWWRLWQRKKSCCFFPVTAYYPYQGHGVGELELIPADIGQEQLIHKFKKQMYWITVQWLQPKTQRQRQIWFRGQEARHQGAPTPKTGWLSDSLWPLEAQSGITRGSLLANWTNIVGITSTCLQLIISNMLKCENAKRFNFEW